MMPLRHKVAFLALGVCLLASPSLAAIGRTPDIAPLTDTEFRAIVAPAMVAAQAQDCARVLALLDPAVPRVVGRNRTAAQMLRLPCLAAGSRAGEVAGVYQELIENDPQNGIVRNVGVLLALSTGDFAEAGNRLASLAEDAPAALDRMTGTVARGIVQALTEKGAFQTRDRLFIALARADWQPPDRPEMRDGLARGAIDALIGKGRTEEAATLLSRVTAPELLAGMAMERHYAPLWPAIEQRLGVSGGDAIDRFAAQRLDAFANRPDDPEARRDAVRSFLLLGRFAEANDAAAPAVVKVGMSEADVVTVRYDAQALAAQGKVDAAIARLRPFATLDLKTAPTAAAGLVSLAEMLDENGREEDALAVARQAIGQGEVALSPWGVGWLKRTEVCALAALGRDGEARPLGDALKAAAADNQPAAIEGLLCLKRQDDAAAIAAKALASPEGAGTLADQFQPDRALWAVSQSRLRALWTPLRERRDVKPLFDKAVRILPERLWPSRMPRPIPHIPRPDDVPVA